MTRTVLLTGATGFLGGELIRRLMTWDGGIRLVVLLRAPSEAHAQFRGTRLLEELARDPEEAAHWSSRVRFVRSDLTAPDLGLSADQRAALADSVTEIVHAGASIRFDQPLEEARAINLGGTRSVLAFARELFAGGRLRRVHHVSTIAVAGRRGGIILEEPVAGEPYNNTYEQSKAEAEAEALAAAGDLPLTVYRVTQLFGDSLTGWTPTFRMSYLFARVVLAGVLPVLPIGEGVVLDGVTVDYAADALYAMILGVQPPSGAIYHLAVGYDAPSGREWALRAITRNLHRDALRAHVDMRFVSPEAFRAQRESFERTLDTAGRTLLAQAELLLPHLDLPPRYFDDTRALATLAGTGVVKRTPYDNLAIDEYFFRSGFGATPEARPPLPSPPRIAREGRR